MNIDLTMNEYMALIEMLHLAGWVVNAHAVEETEDTRRYHDLQQKVFSCAQQFGCGNLVAYDEKSGRYFPSAEMEEGDTDRILRDFEEDTFWSQLAQRLAERDLARELGKDNLGAQDNGDQWERLEEYEGRYWEEFEHHGIERLEVVELPWHEIPNMPRA